MNGLDGYFVARDADGESLVFRDRDDYPVPVIEQSYLRDDPALWDAIVALVEGAS